MLPRSLGLGALCLGLLLTWCLPTAAGTPLRDRLGQLILVRFYGPRCTDSLRLMLQHQHVGGVVLYDAADNIQRRDQVQQLVADVRRAAGVPLLVGIDQEGGRVDRLKKLRGRRPGAALLQTEAEADAAGREDGTDLAALGFNLNLAPVVDVRQVYNPELQGRTFGTDPDTVARLAGAYLRGLQHDHRVVGCLKHFPGLGAVAVDPHQDVPVLDKKDVSFDIEPYRLLLAGGQVHCVMVTHMKVPALDPLALSSLSHPIVSGTLRSDLGFDGVVITDGLSMGAITARYTLGEAAVLTVAAGSDLITDASSTDQVASIETALEGAVRDGRLSEARIDSSIRRIQQLKLWLSH